MPSKPMTEATGQQILATLKEILAHAKNHDENFAFFLDGRSMHHIVASLENNTDAMREIANELLRRRQ